jgi:hypothetical protein
MDHTFSEIVVAEEIVLKEVKEANLKKDPLSSYPSSAALEKLIHSNPVS